MKKNIYSFISFLLLTACASEPLKLNVMTFNIRLDVQSDSLNAWQYRKDVAAKVILANDIDIVGTQEVMKNQLDDLKQRLPAYASIGVGRQDGKEAGEYSAIFYKKDKFTEQGSGNFWLSETPEAVGVKGWDAACERIATWAVLKDIKSNKEFLVINTHFDHIGQVARRQSVALLLDRIAEYSKGLPVIATGDFNAEPDSEVIKNMTDFTNPKHLTHTKDIALVKTGTAWSFHDFGRKAIEERPFIDYIFVNQNVKVNKHEVLADKLDDIYVSDHTPIVAQIEIE